MKIIVSHDVDHLNWSEHYFKDLYIPKLWVRSLKLMLTGVIDFNTFVGRINFLSDKRIHRLEEVMAIEKELQIPATYFFVMRPGLGVAYNINQAGVAIRKVMDAGFDAGVHGMAYNNLADMKTEFDQFKQISHKEKFGIRMHYLRSDDDTRNKLSQTGYLFDTTDYNIAAPYKIGNMFEFPISIMDVYSVRPNHKTFEKAKEYSLQKLGDAENSMLPYFTINFHDMLFDKSYGLYREWFIWILDVCKQKGYSFCSFEDALKDYENGII